jgi:internalin A
LFTRVAYSAKDKTGQVKLVDALQQAVTRLREVCRPLIGRNRLAVWDQLRAWRDADALRADATRWRHRLLPYRDFEALCREHHVHGPETFAEVLHHLSPRSEQLSSQDRSMITLRSCIA